MTDAIAETASRARALFFDREGKRRTYEHYLALLTLHTLIRPAEWFGSVEFAKQGYFVFRWQGDLVVYDPDLATIFLDDPDECADRLLCNAASVILLATGAIADERLRTYASRRLSGDVKPTIRRGRGRTADDNRHRDACIVIYLIPPLLQQFSATRNLATNRETESACSIVSKALAKIGFKLSEKRVAEIWGEYSEFRSNGVFDR